MPSKYEDFSKAQLIELLENRDRTKKLGLVWERVEIPPDSAIDANFVSCEVIPELSDRPAPWSNMIIEGDNFDGLRWLRMTNAGRVKCIYIDPPYNTGNKDWIYNDSYVDLDDRFRQSKWLEFLYQRLVIARDLLADDGVLLVSISDEQRALLELLMDEALPGMRLGSLTWRTRQGSNADHRAFMSSDHEHVLVYGRENFRFSGTEKTFAMYRNFDAARNDWFRLDNLTLGFDHRERPNLFYPLRDPETDIWYPPNPNRVWVYPSRDRSKSARTKFMEDWIAADHIRFPEQQIVRTFNSHEELLQACKNGEVPFSGKSPLIRPDLPGFDFWVGKKIGYGTPAFKRYKKDLKNPRQPLSSWITPRSEADTVAEGSNALIIGTNDEGAKEINSIFGFKAFNYAKPVSLIRELIRQCTGPGDIVVDFFAGSATTAQAVMELNAADGFGRRYIMISSKEATDSEPQRNICKDVTAERVRRINDSSDPVYASLDGGFAYLRTKEIPFEDFDYDLSPAEAWAALEAIHGLPMTAYDRDRSWNLHEGDEVTLVLVDKVDQSALEWLEGKDRQNIFVYAWAPGQIAQHLEGLDVEILSVRDVLLKRFTA
jgi:adenine-specific DNA-methyltransferase